MTESCNQYPPNDRPDTIMELVKWSDDSDDHGSAGGHGARLFGDGLVVPDDIVNGATSGAGGDMDVAVWSPDQVYIMVMG